MLYKAFILLYVELKPDKKGFFYLCLFKNTAFICILIKNYVMLDME